MHPPATTPKTLANGRYDLIAPLGSGGMAVVHRALDHWHSQECAIKLLLPQAANSAKTRTRFLSEARTMAILDHPNVIRVRDVGQEEAHIYFVMELAEGGSVADLLQRDGSLRAIDALGYVFDVLQGLDYAHTAGIVHRDIKPHNMLLSARPPAQAERGTRPSVKLTDFGIARFIGGSPTSRITGTGDTLGTLAYMSPEQRVDPRIAGPQSDLYGVGATMYMMLTGRRPFDLAMAHLDPTVYQRLPPEIAPIVIRATATSPEDRYADARSMAEDIAVVMTQIDPTLRTQNLMGGFGVEGSDTILSPTDGISEPSL